MILPGDKLELSNETLEKIGRECNDVLDDAEQDFLPRFNDYDTWYEWYDAKPASKVKTSPWVGAANIVVPMIQTHADSMTAKTWGKLHRFRSLWSLSTENEKLERRSRPDMERFLNREARSSFDTFHSTFDFVHEFYILGSAVLAASWQTESEWLFTPQSLRNRGSARPQAIRMRRGPKWEFVPRAQMLWEWGTRIEESSFVARQFFYNWSQISAFAQQGDWYPDAVEDIKGQSDSDSPGAHSRRRRRERENLPSDEAHPPFDIRQLWINWPWLKAMGVKDGEIKVRSRNEVVRPEHADWDHIRTPLVITLHRNSGKVLRVEPKPYIIRGWPFVDAELSRRPGGGPAGISKKLEMLQRSASTSMNQTLDGNTLANSIMFKTTDARLKSMRVNLSEPIFLSGTIKDLELIQPGKHVVPDIAMINLANAMAERLSGQSDPNFGREQRSGGHPSPATNFVGLLQESQQLKFPAEAQINKSISRMGEITLTLYQQFETDEEGCIRRIYGTGDAAKIEEWLFPNDETIAGNVDFSVTALSGGADPQAKVQKAVLLEQMNQNYFNKILQLVQAREQGKAQQQLGPQMEKAIAEAITSLTEGHRKFLEASEVDDVNSFLAELDERGQANAGKLQQIAALLGGGNGAAGGDTGTVPGAGDGTPPGAAPVGEGAGSGFNI